MDKHSIMLGFDQYHPGKDTNRRPLEKRDTIRHLVKSRLAGKPAVFGLTPRPGRLPYLDLNCGRSLTEEKDGLDDRHINYIDWILIQDGHDKIDLMFLGYCYAELRQKENPDS
jgi:hypothetical protein